MQESLFKNSDQSKAPLAYRLRPQILDDFLGQNHLTDHKELIRSMIQTGHMPSLVLWGPPGSGKTTLAYILASQTTFNMECLSAVSVGIKEVKEVVVKATEALNLYGKKTILFLDEIHRFNKTQQDSLLPHIENGTIILIGATTENPSFAIVTPLLSRCRVLVLNPLSPETLAQILSRALSDTKHGLGNLGLSIDENARDYLSQAVHGDARFLLNTLETSVSFLEDEKTIGLTHIEKALQKKFLTYDKNGEEHYNVISAFIKSMRGSDVNAALYYLARLLEAGEDPLFIIRRMVIFASEDIGNADPHAITLTLSTLQSFEFVGMPEGWIPMAQCVTYLALSPKSNASYMAYKQAKKTVSETGSLPVPLHLSNAPTKLMKNLGYGKNYQYAHDSPDHLVTQSHLPEKLTGTKFYEPIQIGHEKILADWYEKAEKRRRDKI